MVPVGPFVVAFVRSAGFVPRGAIVVSLPVVVDALDDGAPPDDEALFAEVSGVDDVDRDDAPGVADVDEPEFPDGVPLDEPVDVVPPEVPMDVLPEVPIDVVPFPDAPVVDVSAASATVAKVTPIVEAINVETNLLLRGGFMCAPLKVEAAMRCRNTKSNARSLPRATC